MRVSHRPAATPATVASRVRDESGYTMVITALILVPLLLLSGFSIDVGGWYNRTNEMQRAADAAALAGVVWLPDVAKANAAALEASARNGFTHGTNDITVTVVHVGERRLRVTINDKKVESAIYQSLTGKTMNFTRKATAEYVLPVPLGSPANEIGTGNLRTTNPENFWLAVSGYCASRENGDLLLTESTGNYASANWRSVSVSGLGTRWFRNYTCTGTENNTYYDPDGYVYAVNVVTPGTYAIQAYDATYQTRSRVNGNWVVNSLAGDSSYVTGYTDNSGSGAQDIARINTTFIMKGADATPFDWKDNPTLSTLTVGTNNSTYANQWRQVSSFTAATAGTYYLQVKTGAFTGAGSDTSWGSNSFGLRVGTGTYCTTITGQTGYSATCPQIHGYKDMSILANLAGTQASFYLANVAAIHAGKTFQVTLFDPGEGANSLEVLNPSNTPVSFAWATPCNPPTAATGGCSGTTSNLTLSGSSQTQPGPNRTSDSRYSDRILTINIQLPNNYTGGWWKIRYTVGTSPTDRTTWSARIIGDPVHLIEEE